METVSYRSASQTPSTFAIFPLFVATAVAGINHQEVTQVDRTQLSANEVLPWVERYYSPAAMVDKKAEQIRALNAFAKNLLASTEDSPQEAIDVLNKRFWELI